MMLAKMFAKLNAKVLSWRSGATAAEYALIVGAIAIALIFVLGSLGDALKETFERIVQHLEGFPNN